MKKSIQYSFLVAFLVLSSFISLKAQPHPGEQVGGTSNTGGPIGSGAPVGSGTFMLITLAAAYAGRKAYDLHKNTPEV